MTKTLLIIYDAEGLPGIRDMKDLCTDFETGKQTKKLICFRIYLQIFILGLGGGLANQEYLIILLLVIDTLDVKFI